MATLADSIERFFSADGFMPHGMCYLWRPGVLGLHVTSDALIAAAYFSIPFTLAYFIRKRKGLEFNWIIACFALLIVACGTTHLMEIWTIWYPTYWLSGLIKGITAAASVPTAVLLVKLVPQGLRWPSPSALQRANLELQAVNSRLLIEAAERQRAEAELSRVNEELAARIAERNRQLEEREALEATLAIQLADMRRLHEMSTRLIQAHEPQQILEAILDATIELQEANFGNIQLYDSDKCSLQIVAQRGFSEAFLEHFCVVGGNDESACGRALREHQRVIIEDVEADAAFAPHHAIASQEGFRAIQSTPIVASDGRLTGILSTHFRKPHRPSERDLQLTDLYIRLAAELMVRSQHEEIISSARDAADRANHAKGRFLATASHDLRQPLQTLSLLNGTLHKLATTGEITEAVAQQEQAISAMSGLLSSLLDISKLESGAIRPEIEDFELSSLCNELRVEFTGVAAKKGLRLEVDAHGVSVRSDRTLLGQILRNLLSNAIRYTRNGSVRLLCSQPGELVQIEVADTGVGIATDQLSHIFEEFYQVGVTPNSVREGHGLGLNIVQRVARLLEHDIRVQSRTGEGSVFSVAVPAGTARKAPQAQRKPLEPGSTMTRSTHHVLIVEDDPAVLGATRLLLRVEGYRVSTARSLDEALDKATLHRDIDLLITDFHLGAARGTDVIRSVRDAIGRRIKAVLMTGDTSSAVREIDQNDGVRFASKPIKAEELLGLIGGLLEAR